MRGKIRHFLPLVLAVVMIISCVPVSAVQSEGQTVQNTAVSSATSSSNPWGINVDLSGVDEQVRNTVAVMQAQGEEPTVKSEDEYLAAIVENASGISLGAVRTSLGLELLGKTEGTVDTSRFNLSEAQLNSVMKEVYSEYYLSDVAYQCTVGSDGTVTSIRFMPENEVSAADDMITASYLHKNADAELHAENGLSVSAVEKNDTQDDDNKVSDGVTYTAVFNTEWVYIPVLATDEEIAQGAYYAAEDGNKYAVTLMYAEDPTTGKMAIQVTVKTTSKLTVPSVTLTPNNGGESVTVALTEDNSTCIEMYSFYGNEFPSREMIDEYCGKGTGNMASVITYYLVTVDGVTYGDGPGTDKGVNALGRFDETNLKLQIHWNQMLEFTGDFAQHFGAAGDFWTTKNSKDNPYGAFKTQLDQPYEDYVPEVTMDQYMELMTLAYMSYEMDWGELLDARINDCMERIDEDMTDVQKFLVIHDWLANNAQFDMGTLVKTAEGSGAPEPAQMMAFGTLLSEPMGYDGVICLGYAATFAVLVQHAFSNIYQNEDGTWKTAKDVGDDDIVDLVQIRFYVDLAEISVAGANSGFGDPNAMFSSSHYYNAVKVGNTWYNIDPCYDDISTEVMDQCRVETDGNISHKYFMIAPTNMLTMFEDSIDYIDCLYDGVVFNRTPDASNPTGYVTEYIDKYNEEHVVWTKSNTDSETASDNDQYEATWFSGAVSEITHDENYWYYVTGPSYSYASMMSMMDSLPDGLDISSIIDSMGGEFGDNSEKLVRRPIGAPDEPDNTSSGSSGGYGEYGDFSIYEDPYAEILFHFGYGSVVPGESEDYGDYYDQVVIDEFYRDLYPDLVHSVGLYDGVLYFNLANKVYTMTGATKEYISSESVEVTQLKEYNDVYAKTDGRDFTGMSFYSVSKDEYEKEPEENDDPSAFHVFNRPVGALSIEDKYTYGVQYIFNDDYTQVIGIKHIRNDTPTPTLTVSIATNYSESYKTVTENPDDAESYKIEAVDYNPDYSRYTDDGEDEDVNDNEEFMWCANVVDAMPMDDMLKDKNSGEKSEVTVIAWCGQDGYTEARTTTYGLSDGENKDYNFAPKSDVPEDPALNHHFIYNEREECYICVHCSDPYHGTPEDYEEEDAQLVTFGHYIGGEDFVIDKDSVEWLEDYRECKVDVKAICAERHCGYEIKDTVECDIEYTIVALKDEDERPVDNPDAQFLKTVTASYKGELVDTKEIYINFVLGDVNGDGEYDRRDLVAFEQYFAGYGNSINEDAADVNCDGYVDRGDLVLMEQERAGYDVTFGPSTSEE